MPLDEMQPPAAGTKLRQPGSAAALLQYIRLSQEETADPSLFVAPGRLRVARRMLEAGLFTSAPMPEPGPNNDN